MYSTTMTVWFSCLVTIALAASDLQSSYITSFVGTTFQQCREQCVKRPSCLSVVYNRRATYCKLFDRTFSEYKEHTEPGVMYKEETNRTRGCHGTTCNEGEVCSGSCIRSECPKPPAIPGSQRNDNRRQIHSKIHYKCVVNILTEETFAECQSDGTWTTVETMMCETPGYEHYGPDKFMPRDDSVFNKQLGHFEFKGRNLEECLKRCNESTEFCIAVNYLAETGTCMSKSGQPHLNTQVELITKPGWSFYAKIMPIFYITDTNETYSFSFEEAKSRCESLNTTLASKSDLQMAYDLGFASCSCGWVQEGVAVLSMKFADENCLSTNGFVGVFDCWEQDKFDIYCKNPWYL